MGAGSVEMQAAARKEIQDEWRSRREVQIKKLQEYNLQHPCDFCRDLEHGSGDGSAYGLVFDSHTITCPECGWCFWSEES